ncbi:MAG: FAD-dependent oxidoreductase [Planctomycetota bacterium]
MKVAIIGGGVAGVVCAYLLHEVHEVTLFERAPQPGGNVRTLGGNVPCAALPPGVRVENGTLGFQPSRYPTAMRLLAHLELETVQLPARSGVFFPEGGRLCLPGQDEPAQGLREAYASALTRLTARAAPSSFMGPALPEGAIGPYLPGRYTRFGGAIRALMLLSYSTPAPLVDELHRERGEWVLRMGSEAWQVLRDGTSSYLQRALERMGSRLRLLLPMPVEGVRRTASAVEVEHTGGCEAFDRVVFATTPDQVLGLLRDPTPEERERFGPWRQHRFPTVAHDDPGLYRPWGVAPYSCSDLFVGPGERLGYNTYLSHQALPGRPFSFGHGIEDLLDPARVLDRHEHVVPRYEPAAMRQRPAIAAHNGERHTFHAGAYLGDGLQEGAVASALEVSRRLGGRLI